MNDPEFTQQLDRIRQELIKQGYYHKMPEQNGQEPNYSHINNGFCGVFSSQIILLYESKVELCCSGGIGTEDDKPFVEFSRFLPEHYFIKFNGKYYDAECIEGVKNYLDLPLFEGHRGFWRRLLYRIFRKLNKIIGSFNSFIPKTASGIVSIIKRILFRAWLI